MRIALTDEELLFCAEQGGRRLINALSRGRRGAHGFNRFTERWQIDIEGVCSEMAAAKALNLEYVPTVGKLDSDMGDIGPGLQVRGTKYDTGSLLIHDSDQDLHRFILVTGIYGVYDIRGWIFASEGKNKRFTKTYKGRTAYWVGQEHLRPMSELPMPLPDDEELANAS